MTDFDHILNWELKAGSHQYPGPAGGTCINEAAIVAAGFEYKQVKSWRDCPPCFSPVLSAFAICVNDSLANGQRQELMPLVVKLAGSAGEPWVETARIRFILDTMLDLFDREALRAIERQALYRGDYGQAGRHGALFHDVLTRLNRLQTTRELTGQRPAEAAEKIGSSIRELANSFQYLGQVRWKVAEYPWVLDLAADETSSAILEYQTKYLTAGVLWRTATEALTRAFEIGPRAPELDTAQVVERMAPAKKAAVAA